MVQLDEITACNVRRLCQIRGVLILLTIGILLLIGGHTNAIVLIKLLVCLFHVGNGNRCRPHSVLFAEKINSAILPIIVKVYPITARSIGKPQFECQILDELVVHLSGIKAVSQQHPCLYLFLISQQISRGLQLDLIGFLFSISKGRIASSLQLAQPAVVNRSTICGNQRHLSVRHYIILVCINKGNPLVFSICAGQIQCGQTRSLHHAEGHRLSQSNSSSNFPITRCVHICNSGYIHGIAQINSSLITSQRHFIAYRFSDKGQGKRRQICGSRQEKVLCAINFRNCDILTIHCCTYAGDIRRSGTCPRMERIRPPGTVINLIIFSRNLRASGNHKVVVRVLLQTGNGKGSLICSSHRLPAITAVVLIALEYLIILCSGCGSPCQCQRVV